MALLLLHANRAVSRDELVDALWGTDPPRSAVQSLQVYVHGLRQALGADRIETQGTGYRLRVEPGELDAARFEELLAGAERSLAAGAPSEAAEKLETALGLWRGTALADLAGERVAEASAPVLAEQRLRAVELLNDAQLALGRHEQLTSQLEQLVAAEPYRERFHAQQMVALYRSGRQTEALEAYRHARETLLELGVDPSGELQELERRILRQDPTLAAPSAREPAGVNLPVPATSLVGRRLEVAAVIGLLRGENVRLLTLTGPGGTGKTRLALAVAAELGPALADGACFVDLAALDDPSLLAATIAHALDIAEGSSAEDALSSHVRDRRLLLVLDNVEQLVPDVGVIGRLVAAAPRLLVLATSRTALRLSAEHEYPVPPLAVPSGASFEEIAASDAVRLFVARARAVDPAFALDDASAGAVAHICERLDGLPLAIELAAARSKLFTPAELSARLDRRLDVLTGGPHDVPERQRTLRAALAWSYDLLDDDERRLFSRLGVFPGSWTLDAAQKVCGNGRDLTDGIGRLVDSSLVRRLERPGEARFAMLETLSEYAREQLAASGDADAVAQRHAEYVLQALVAARSDIVAADTQTFARLEDGFDNIRAAIAWFAASGNVEAEVAILEAAQNFLNVRGRLSEARAWLEAAVARSGDAPPRTGAVARIHCAAFAYRQGDYARSKELAEEALVVFRELGDVGEIGRSVGTLGNVAVSEGDLDRATELYEESAALSRADGNDSRLAVLLANLGAIAGQRGDQEGSARYASEAVALQRAAGELDTLSVSLHNLGRAQLALGDVDAARSSLTESLALAREVGYPEVIAYDLSGLAELAVTDGHLEQAAELLGASQERFRELGVHVDAEEERAQERVLSAVYDALGTARADALRADGAKRPLDELYASGSKSSASSSSRSTSSRSR